MLKKTHYFDPQKSDNQSLIFANANRVISPEETFLKKVEKVIIKNIGVKSFGLPELAREVHLSISQLNRKLNILIGRPGGQLIREMRLYYAAELLTKRNEAISDIAYQTGFYDPAHFCRSFKKLFDCSPSEFRKTNLDVRQKKYF